MVKMAQRISEDVYSAVGCASTLAFSKNSTLPVLTGPLHVVRKGSMLAPQAVGTGSLLYAECRAIPAALLVWLKNSQMDDDKS
jgi:hypothetical protein